jgi:hypothetical protein
MEEDKEEKEKEQWFNCSACGRKTHVSMMNVIEGKDKTLTKFKSEYKELK